jgi:hypothetical protein
MLLFSCGLALSTAVGARNATRTPAPSPTDDPAVIDLATRSQIVSTEFQAGLARAAVRVRRVNHALGRAADGLSRVAGN